MPKNTFYNLPEEKKSRVVGVLKETFSDKSIYQANVKEIVEKLDIARGSFYKYFEDIEDAYFTILDMETADIHKLFLSLLEENNFDIHAALEVYGYKLAEILFEPDNYGLYKNRYLNWTPDLEGKWRIYLKEFRPDEDDFSTSDFDKDQLEFIKAAVHNLIQRTYLEAWAREDFLLHYKKYMKWLKGGI
ncbi:TetR/AcrR family transcriptional regulator [uncultured Ezakiella sp.]|uniref:TetR/AcrR family transcriptional regulator n=1 Tax=uncultured Ezakiella sp. TaxID=1637529 RepID=UPI0025DAD2E9|nr:TetR/AcrR family transcriptional regulator [uncultured Ezakiella sp.]